MSPYFFIAFILFLFALCEVSYKIKYNSKRVILFSLSIILLFFSSLAISRGDAIPYRDIFYGYFSDEYGFIESGFKFLAAIINCIGFSVISFFFVVGLINISSKSLVLVNTTDYPLVGIFIWFTATFISQEMGALRFSIATSCVFLVIYLLRTNKKLPALILICISASMHIASLVILLLFLIEKVKLTNLRALVVLFVVLIFFYLKINIIEIIIQVAHFFVPFFADKAAAYVTIAEPARLELGILKRVAFFLFIILVGRNIDNNSLYVKTYFLSIILYFIFAPVNIMAQRFSILFGAIEPVIIIFILKSFDFKSRKYAFFLIAVIYFFNLWSFLTKYSNEVNTWIPYKLFFFGDYVK